MVPIVAMVLPLMPTIRQSNKLSNLKTWLKAPVMSNLLGIKPVYVVAGEVLLLEVIDGLTFMMSLDSHIIAQ